MSVAWHHDVKSAWKSTQQQGRPLLVFVTTSHCLYCTKMKQATYSNAAVAATINRSFVPLVLDGQAPSPLLQDLVVKAFPATFIISQDAVILDRLDGYVPPDKLMARLAACSGPGYRQNRPPRPIPLRTLTLSAASFLADFRRSAANESAATLAQA